jgi:hypothetical protein
VREEQGLRREGWDRVQRNRVSQHDNVRSREGVVGWLRRRVRRLLDAIEVVRRTLTDEDLAYAEYRRHVDAHPFQNGYAPMFSDGKTRESFDSKLLGRRVPIEELKALIDRRRRDLEEPPGIDGERLIAIEIASKVTGPLQLVVAAILTWATCHELTIQIKFPRSP